MGSDHPESRQGGVGKTKLRDLTELLVLLSEVVRERFLCWTEPAPSAGALSVVRELAQQTRCLN